MNDKKYVVPQGMLDAALAACDDLGGKSLRGTVETILLFGLQWLADNATMPTNQQYIEMRSDLGSDVPAGHFSTGQTMCQEWIKRMFLAPEPEVPEAIKRMQRIHILDVASQTELDRLVEELLIEAYRRGQQSKG